MFESMSVVGGAPYPVNSHVTSKKVTYYFTYFATFDVSSLYFDENKFLQYMQGNDIRCVSIFRYMRQHDFMLPVAFLL